MTVTAQITDNLSGVSDFARPRGDFFSPSGGQSVGITNLQRQSGDALDGIYTGTVTVPRYAEQGTWTLFQVVLEDVAGNSAVLRTDALAAAGLPTTFQNRPLPTDTTRPAVTITSPPAGASYTIGQTAAAGYTCGDETGGSGLAACTGQVNGVPIPSGGPLSTQNVGAQTLVVTARDNAGNTSTATAGYVVFASLGNASGRVEPPPAVNTALKAGATVPIRFSLGGDYGLGIFATGFPSWRQVSCTTLAADPTDPGTPTEASAAAGLSYDATTGQYNYRWKTDKAWANQCWQLAMRFGPDAGGYAGATIAFNFRLDK